MRCDRAGIKQLLAPWDYHPEAVETYGRAMEAAMGHQQARAVLEGTVQAYQAGETVDIKGVLAQMDTFAAPCGQSPYTMQMLPYLCLLEPARAKYAAAGLEEGIYHDSFADLLWKTRECHRIYGVWGSFVAAWFYRFFELKCFALDRLQFELTDFRADAPLNRGERVINVHVPSCGPLREADCEASYARAAAFFQMEDRTGGVPFVCDSWLLHPLCAGLGETSGIRRFAARYRLLYIIDDPGYGDMWIIFGRPWDGEPDGLPEDTALPRLFNERL